MERPRPSGRRSGPDNALVLVAAKHRRVAQSGRLCSPNCRVIRFFALLVRQWMSYLGDIGVPFNPAPMDFNAWFEVYLGGTWHSYDARHNERRIGRIPIARGRDACDVPMADVRPALPQDLFRHNRGDRGTVAGSGGVI